MYLSGDAKDLLYKCTILTAQTYQSLVWSNFPQVNVKGKQNKSQKTLLCKAMNVSNAHADLSLHHSHVLQVWLLLVFVQPNSIRTIQIHFVDCSGFKTCLCERGRLSSKLNRFQFEHSIWSVVSVVAWSAPFNRQSLMMRYVYIRAVHNIGKKFVILLRWCAGWSESSLLQRKSLYL